MNWTKSCPIVDMPCLISPNISFIAPNTNWTIGHVFLTSEDGMSQCFKGKQVSSKNISSKNMWGVKMSINKKEQELKKGCGEQKCKVSGTRFWTYRRESMLFYFVETEKQWDVNIAIIK